MSHTVYVTLTLARRKYTIESYRICFFTPRKVREVSHNAPNPVHPARHTGVDSRGGGPHPSGLGEERSRGPEAPPFPSPHASGHNSILGSVLSKTVGVPMISAHRKSLTKLILGSGCSAPHSSSQIQFNDHTTSWTLPSRSAPCTFPASCRHQTASSAFYMLSPALPW